MVALRMGPAWTSLGAGADAAIAAVLAAAGDRAGPDAGAVVRAVLDPAEPTGTGRSSLDHDGSPLLLRVSLGAGRRSCRVIGDPAATLGDRHARAARARAALGGLLALRGPELRGLCERTLAATAATGADLATLPGGALWLAGELAGPGLGLCTSSAWGHDDDRWSRVWDWLDDVLHDPGAARRALAPVRGAMRVVACALEGDQPARARARLYLRPRVPMLLSRLGMPLLADPRVAALLGTAIDDATLRRDTLIYTLAIRVADGALADAGIEVCAHCIRRPRERWLPLLDDWARVLGHTGFGVEPALHRGAVHIASVGVAVDADGELRADLQIKPR